ncbi:RidA family protein [Paenibacillus sp. J2TS4]|uniref:RidA family protein n=1 Tax=Paenibacillus sp. J2TS4 TaxID=2807194 RepID=UPI001B0FAA32|nr:RidA family protein [Paenibacillus sp. J2TS4]GIP34636.1 reactive intermediate/imine deaminase [Paenibacillus sp. J2TS4]
MSKKFTAGKEKRLPFSSAVQTGSYVYVSGQGGIDPQTHCIVGLDLESQTRQTMDNIREVLTAASLDWEHVVKVNVYLADRSLYEEFNQIYARYFNSFFPARTLVYCALNYDLLVEIDVIASREKPLSVIV